MLQWKSIQNHLFLYIYSLYLFCNSHYALTWEILEYFLFNGYLLQSCVKHDSFFQIIFPVKFLRFCQFLYCLDIIYGGNTTVCHKILWGLHPFNFTFGSLFWLLNLIVCTMLSVYEHTLFCKWIFWSIHFFKQKF